MGDPVEPASVPSDAARPVEGAGLEKSTALITPPQEMLKGLAELPCFCIALTLAATALALAIPMILRDYLPPCREPNCFQYAAEMALSVDPAVDPCSDFFGHVCGNFEDLYPRHSSLLAVLATRVSQFQDSVLNRLETSSSAETPGEATVAAFRVCVDQYRAGDEGGLHAIRDLLWELGLFLRAKPVTHTVENVFVGVVKLSLSFDLPVLVRAVLVHSLKQTAHNKLELQFDLHMPVAPVDRTVDSVEDSLRAVAHNGTFSRFRHLASAALGSLKLLESQVAAAPSWDGGIQYVRFADVQDGLLEFMTTERLINVSNDAVSVDGYFDGESELATTNPELLMGFASFATQQGGARLLNLVRYLLVERLLPVSSPKLADIYNVTGSEAFSVRVAACRREVVGLTPRAWADLIFRNLLGLKHDAVDALARDVVNAAFDQLDAGGGWMADAETAERARQRLQRTRLLLGRAAVKDNLKARYSHVKAPSSGSPFVAWLIQTLQMGRRRLAEHLRRGSAAPNLDVDDPELQVLDSEPNAILDPVRLEVLVTPAMLFSPFRVEGVPSAVNYGAIGSLVGSLLSQSLDPSVGAYDVLGRRLGDAGWFSEDSLSARKATLACVGAKVAAHESSSLSDDQTNEVLSNTVGLRLAHAAFLAKLDDNDTRKATDGDVPEWRGPFYSGRPDDAKGLQRLFFAAHCFQLCGVSLPRGVTTSTLPLRDRCNLPLMNYAEFGRAFDCPANSVMAADATNSCFPEPMDH
ncbi:neprilysin-1-like [Dermacentor andersoni]|uniref:neprilysin-1-like n=1 Tax=Dermacentor andersoni TaxID=34620 RepID=UPI0021552E0D|nr:uncharacterized protein LOC126517849 [Dermacentor andersoni]